MLQNPSSQWIIGAWDSLQEYRDQWIAANQDGLVAHDSSVATLIDILVGKQYALESLAFAYIFDTEGVYQ